MIFVGHFMSQQGIFEVIERIHTSSVKPEM